MWVARGARIGTTDSMEEIIADVVTRRSSMAWMGRLKGVKVVLLRRVADESNRVTFAPAIGSGNRGARRANEMTNKADMTGLMKIVTE